MNSSNQTYDHMENLTSENVTGSNGFDGIGTTDDQYNCSDYYGDAYPCDYYYNDTFPQFEQTEFLYEGFDFERPIYLFIWEILVIYTTLFNVVVVIVLSRKQMRNVIHMVLAAIAISDSMTGLVTLPTYIYTYSQYEPGGEGFNPVYVLDKHWCNAFMISKFFLSKWFHNVSIWLTLFLGVQRSISVIFPLRTQRIFTMRNTLIFIVIIFVLSPILHMYHLTNSKANIDYGFCSWSANGNWSLVYLWATLLLMHLIPCLLLVILTIVMIYRLFSSTSKLTRREGSNASMIKRRHVWNRRMSIIVSAIVVCLLIPEIPYGIFLLSTVIKIHSKTDIMRLEVNRAFHAGYEILLVLSFHANFWIYTVLNKRFRSELKKTFEEIRNFVCFRSGKPARKISITSKSSFSGGKTSDSYISERSGMKLKRLDTSCSSDSNNERHHLKKGLSSGTTVKENEM